MTKSNHFISGDVLIYLRNTRQTNTHTQKTNRDLSNNELKEVPVGVFRTLRRLTVLHLSSNKLERLDENLMRGLNQLEDVDLSRNELNELPPLLLDGISILLFKNSNLT
jgi:Leucine-rich repeat (LRR) protein